MAKTARLKNSNKAPSTHSRASRRASSPSLNLDKSLPTLQPPRRSDAKPILSARHGAGITKAKAKPKGKVLKRKQKMRIERGKDRAEAVADKTERKRGSARRGEGRNADWDELNEKIGGKRGKGREGERGGEGEGWVDEDEGMDGDGDGDGGGGKEVVENEDDVKDGVDVLNAVEEEIL